MRERPVVIGCCGEALLGILHPGRPQARLGVLIIVGGPQYRVGSHRQFVLLARALDAAGIPTFRFDYRGMGDASGEIRGFEEVQPDIRAALDSFFAEVPELERVVLWGLCDAASAALDYAWRDSRVQGLVLLNPWVRTEQGLAKTYLKHYYWRRLRSKEFWTSVLKGRVNALSSLRSLWSLFATLMSRVSLQAEADVTRRTHDSGQFDDRPLAIGQPLPERMAEGWRRFRGRILLILSGNDLTASEFVDCVAQSTSWAGFLEHERVEKLEIENANHTFSSAAWRGDVASATCRWILTLEDEQP